MSIKQPNILFILSDQHNAKVLGHKGHPDVKTPHLDRMATEGVRFNNAITQNPVCTPSRVSWLSGQYCHNHGYYGLSNLEDHEAMQEFGDRGRQTVEGRPSKVSYEDGQEGWSVRKATEFMEQCAADDVPFFTHVSLPKRQRHLTHVEG